MIQVWQYHGGVTRTPAFPEDYDHVATVGSDDLGYVVERTRNDNGSWALHPDVEMQHGHTECRSTEIGDVLVSATGAAYRVGPFGFGEVTDGRGGVTTEQRAEAPQGMGHIAWVPNLQSR